MDIRRRLDKEIEKQEANLADLRNQVTAAEAYLQAQKDMLKMLPKETDPSKQADIILRPGSDPAKIREMLQQAGKPLHISDILKKMGRETNKETRSSISGTLSSYVRRGVVFTRPAPNTFALIQPSEETPQEEPPDDFGSDDAPPAT